MSNSSRILPELLLALIVLLASRLVSGGFFQFSILSLLLFVIAPSLLIKSLGGKLGEYGLCLGNFRSAIKYTIIILALAFPIMLYGSQLPSFKSYYPLWKPAYQNIGNLMVYEAAIGILMFATEFFYRGFLLFRLSEKTRYGNLIQALVYAIMHLGKPFVEVPYSFVAGLVFGEIDFRCKSILPSFLIHFIGNIIFDLLLIYSTGIMLL